MPDRDTRDDPVAQPAVHADALRVLGGTVYAEQPRKLVLVGVLGADEIDNLTEYCRRLFASGQMTVKLDMASVSDCHRAALDGLTALRAGSAGLGVSVEGACWPQFFLLLAQRPTVEINDVCTDIRALVPVPRSH